MNGISYSPGMLYVGLPGELTLYPLGDVVQELDTALIAKDAFEVQQILTLHEQEATFTINLTKEQIKNLYDVVFRTTEIVLSIVRGEGNARVAHLAKYGRKRRTRKKNVRRAFRIAERM